MAGARSDNNGVERLPSLEPSTAVTDELGRLLSMLRDACPKNAIISFAFNGTLHVHIDVRTQQDGTLVEAMLPSLGLGLFHDVVRGSTPHHPFYHRVSARVAR